MYCKSWKRLIPFFITFICGVLITTSFQKMFSEKLLILPLEVREIPTDERGGTGCGECSEINQLKTIDFESKAKPTNLTVISKPKPNYTDEARENETQGTVTLRVTFLANGTIGSISPVNALPNGLTETAIEAARQIKFEPAMKNGRPITVTKLVEYSFTLF